MKGRQLPLSVQLQQTPELDNFFVGPNAEALHAVRGLRGGLLLFGAARSGKTHLLQGLVRSAGAQGLYLPLRSLLASGVETLAGAAARDPLCIDDIDAVCGDERWELALLRLLDELRARERRVLLSAASAPGRLPLRLPDLRTRLDACAVIGLKPLRDADRRALLEGSATRRGLELPPDSIRWLLNHCPRDAGSLLVALEELDRAALSAQRRLTCAFVQQTLAPSCAPAPLREQRQSD